MRRPIHRATVSFVPVWLSRATAIDAAVLAGGLAAAQLEIWDWDGVPGPGLGRALPLLLLLLVPLVWRRSHPLAACVAVMAGLAAFSIARGSPEGLELLAPLAVVSYSVAAHSERRGALAGLAVLIAGYTVYALEDPNVTGGTVGDLWASAFFGVAMLALWLLGVFVHSHREAGLLSARAAALERESELAVSEERARMARELHDIVSHNLSVVVLQAAGARASGTTGATLEKIERSGREALVEMRRLLGVLREDPDGSELAPQPGLAQLDDLAASVRSAGLPVELTIGEDCRELSPAVELCAYRIVQEALTNALKHAGSATVRVAITRAADSVAVEVVDDGRGNGAASHTGGGHGLLGMRERVALFGGELHAGSRPEGGFVVRARLPVA
jgi:signal transduction histidine kinase